MKATTPTLVLAMVLLISLPCILADSQTPSNAGSNAAKQPASATTSKTSIPLSADGDCLSHGCPLLPLDLGSKTVQTATDMLRDGKHTSLAAELSLAALSTGGSQNQTVMTLCGYKGGSRAHQINQDRAVVYDPLRLAVPGFSRFVGVFDGHGRSGEITSQHAMVEIPKRLSQRLAQIEDVHNADAVAQLLQDIFVDVDRTDPTRGMGGSTASCIVQIDDRFYIANTGDSTSFVVAIVRGMWVQVVAESAPHKPDDPDEKARIEAAGGYVHMPKSPNEDVPRVYHVDEQGYLQYGLAMSRSIGDHAVVGATPVPTVTQFDVDGLRQIALDLMDDTCSADYLTQQERARCLDFTADDIELFRVSMTDGMADYLGVEEVAASMANAFLGLRHPHVAAQDLVQKAASMWNRDHHNSYRDDIAIAACKFTEVEADSRNDNENNDNNDNNVGNDNDGSDDASKDEL